MDLRKMAIATTGFALTASIFASNLGVTIPSVANAAGAQSTNNSIELTYGDHYDRNSTLLAAADGTYWMFFARSVDPCTRGVSGCGNGGDADNTQYNIFYMQSSDQSTWSNPVQLSSRTSLDNNFRGRTIAATQDSTGTIWVFWASGSNSGPLYYFTKSPNQPWSTINTVDTTPVYFNVEAVSRGSELWLFYEDGTGAGIFSRSYLGNGNWTAPSQAAPAGMSIPKVYVDGGTFYMSVAKTDTWPMVSDYVTTSTDGLNWSTPTIAAPGDNTITNWDPMISAQGNKFNLFFAPDTGDGAQHIAWTQSSKRGASWPGSSLALTTASYGATKWWDYWPEATVIHGDTYLTYTSERNADATGSGPAHIWLLAVPNKYNP